MARTHVKVRLLIEEYEMAQECAQEFFEGNLSSFIRKAIGEWYKHKEDYRKLDDERIEEIRKKIGEYKSYKRRVMASGNFGVETKEVSEVD